MNLNKGKEKLRSSVIHIIQERKVRVYVTSVKETCEVK